MSTKSSDQPVHVNAEERLHPALRMLGGACIALARWQREQANTPAAKAAATPPEGTEPKRTARAPNQVDDQEARHA